MPRGKTHTRINIFLLPLFVFVGYTFHQDYKTILVGALVYIYSTLYFNPDLDIATMNRLFTVKGLLTLPMRIFYAPFFRHRGLSHTLWGTFVRLLVMAFIIVFAIFLTLLVLHFLSHGYLATNDVKEIAKNSKDQGVDLWVAAFEYQKHLIAGLVGLVLADLSHIWSDRLF